MSFDLGFKCFFYFQYFLLTMGLFGGSPVVVRGGASVIMKPLSSALVLSLMVGEKSLLKLYNLVNSGTQTSLASTLLVLTSFTKLSLCASFLARPRKQY